MLKKKIRPKPVKNKNSLAPMVPAAFEICHRRAFGVGVDAATARIG